MSHFGDHMDGVPVKISEKYKRPPPIELPYSVTECPSRAQNIVSGLQYCCTFEKNVLAKLKELRSAKETRKNERRHRLQLLVEAKQKKLDLIAAAEAEERLKQLSVSEVSYPSTEEISEISPDDQTDKTYNNTITEEPLPDAHTDTQLNILQPIQVMSNIQQNSLLDDPDPLQELKRNVNMAKITQYNTSYSKHNIDKLTFSDFESDTSSPFDNVELKTINDMELLAQVLQSQRESATSCQPPQMQCPPEPYSTGGCASSALMYNSPQHYPIANGYYTSDNICDNSIPVDMYLPNYQYYIPVNQYQPVDYVPDSMDLSGPAPPEPYIPQPYYFTYPPPPVPYQPGTTFDSSIQSQNVTENTTHNPSISSSNTMKSRSRSVPDIVNEINEELVSAKLRASERSYNASPAPKEVTPRPSSSSGRRSRKKCEQLPNPLEKLSPQQQTMCTKIQGMGFPLERVARVCSLVGDNDKKVIEGLLMVGELMDLGFPESRVSAALAKHQFNRDRALDDLVQ